MSGAPQTFFFRESEGALFGCFHPARAALVRGTAILCQPYGHEYARAHRACRQLAEGLAHAGHAVLRFDFYGSGDSEGRAEDATLAQWLRDVAAAAREARLRSHCPRVCLIGARLGGAIAWLAAAGEGIANALVLWDPIVRGADYVTELAAGEQVRRRALWSRVSPSPVNGEADEYIGVAYSRQLLRELGALDLTTASRPRVERTLVIRTEPPGHGVSRRGQLGDRVPALDERVVPAPRLWTAEADGLLLAPQSLLETIRTWLGEAMP